MCVPFSRNQQEPEAMWESGVTLLDAAEAWLRLAVVAHPPLADWVESFEAQADAQVRAWQLREDAVLRGLKDAETRAVASAARAPAGSAAVLGATRAVSFVLARMVRGVLMGHETFSIFTAPADEPLPRHHKVLLLCSALLAMLCASIWMEYNRGANCCFAIRDLLGCDGDPTGPCRGFTGTCGDIARQFADVPLEDATGDAPAILLSDFQCREFPDPVRAHISQNRTVSPPLIAGSVALRAETVLCGAVVCEAWARYCVQAPPGRSVAE